MGTTTKAERNPRSNQPEGQTLADDSKTLADRVAAGGTPRSPVQVPDHQLLSCIGRGSYGEVWLARNVMGTYRAVKIVYRAAFEHARPFEREFNGIQKFEPISRSHDGFVDVLQIGRIDDYFYYVMELADDVVSGQQIDPATYEPKTLRSQVQAKKPLAFEQCVELGLSLTTALGHLHGHGLIHRDIKPSNIIFVNGIPKLADIGLVAEQSEAKSFVGTEGFIPPEGPGTPQADIYSLGKVLYEMATGKDRHEFPTLPTLVGESATDTHFLELNSVVLKACQSDTRQRYQNAAQMREDLLLLQSGKSVKRAQAIERRLALATRLALVAAATVLLALVALYWTNRQAKREAKLRNQALAAKREAETNAASNLRLLISSHVANGSRLVEQGEVLSGLPYWLEALRLEPDPVRAEMHRIRLSTALRQSPKPRHVWFHRDQVLDLALSPDGTLAATASRDKTARVWNLETGEALTPWLSHSNEVDQVLFSPDGKLLLTRDTERSPGAFELPDHGTGAVTLWQIPAGELIFRVAHSNVVSHAEFSPDGALFVTACCDGYTRICRVQDGSVTQAFKHPAEVTHATFSPDGKLLVTSCKDDKVRCWEVETGRTVQTWEFDSEPEESWAAMQRWIWQRQARFNRDGHRIFAIDGKQLRAWDINTNTPAFSLRSDDPFNTLELDPSGTELLVTDSEANARLVNSRTGVARLTFRHLDHPSPVHADFEAHFSDDGSWIVSYDLNHVLLWLTRVGRPLPLRLPTPASVLEARLSSEGRFLLLACGDGTARVWDLISTEQGKTAFNLGHQLNNLRISKSGERFYTSTYDARVEFWDRLTSHSVVEHFPDSESNEWGELDLQLSPEEQHVFVADKSGNARVFNAATGRPAGPFLKHGLTNGVLGAFTGEPDRVVTGDGRGFVRLWSFATGQPVAERPEAHNGPITFLAAIPGRRLLATGGADGKVRLWSSADLTPFGHVLQHTGGISCLASSPVGKLLAASSFENGLVLVWNIETGEVVQHWNAPDRVTWLVCSPVHSWIAAACADRFVRIWDIRTGATRLNVPTIDRSDRLAVTRDGRLLAAEGIMGGQIWDSTTGERVSPLLRVDEYFRSLSGIQFVGQGEEIAGGGVNWARIWDLRPESYTLPQWELAVASVSGQRLSKAGGLEALPPRDLSNAWQQARAQFPGLFVNTDAQVVNALFPTLAAPSTARPLVRLLDRLIEAQPNDVVLRRKRALSWVVLGDYRRAGLDDPAFRLPARDPGATTAQVDLTAHYNRLLCKNGLGFDQSDFAELVPGLRTLDGTRFDVRGIVALGGGCPWGEKLPTAASNIPVNAKCQVLHFLHATFYESESPVLVGRYVLHYANGATEELPIYYGQDTRNWWTVPGESPVMLNAEVVWRGNTPAAAKQGSTIRLWKRTYKNPHPESVIVSLDFISAMAWPAPFLIAATVE
jgi:WD40 repeat protein